MKTSWLTILPVWLLGTIVTASTPLQYCSVDAEEKTDLCFAVASFKNSTTQANDLSLHISTKFVVDATGWASVAIGPKMDNALMFIMYPGGEQGRITVSTRTTRYHAIPKVVSEDAPETHVTKTWIDDTGLYNAQIMCYNCESWSGTTLDVMSPSQPWIWATNWDQPTHSDDVHLKLRPHNAKGFTMLNMASSYSESGDIIAQVSTQRITQEPNTDDAGPAPPTMQDESDDHHPAKEHHKHSAFGLVSLHGFLLSFGFFALTFGVLGIRSGSSKSYKIHWTIQTGGGSAIVVGCLMGIYLSYKHGGHFGTFHQWIGLSMIPSVIIQGLLGYLHHVNYLKYGRRTAVSYYHIWLGRAALIIGNLNVGFGLNLAGAESFKWFTWYAGLAIQLSVLIPMWYFYARGKTILDAVRNKPVAKDVVRYESVEQDAFIVDDELDEFEDEGLGHDDLKNGKD
ncbi:CBD9-like protein [Mollisia scopiformis]|uniref:CBD9-like protein n=1 Tax=Mollisia scopiformis TaxID=149040 RepID=A0A132B9L2_MOLSC|nr:CBD9-like protein [Mollisia scopiformis]KUJ08943.1 CBD9-like protein [Mollisia scopiformis]